jgi:hypothetical protein
MNNSTLGAVAAIAVAACSPALAADPAPAGTTTTTSELRIVRDKETGQLRAPTESEAREMAAAEQKGGRKAAEKIVVVTHPDGMRSAVLPESYMTTLYVVRDAEGNIAYHHSDPALDSNPVATAEEK